MLQIGSTNQSSKCNVNTRYPVSSDSNGWVFLQYTRNKVKYSAEVRVVTFPLECSFVIIILHLYEYIFHDKIHIKHLLSLTPLTSTTFVYTSTKDIPF